VGESVRRLVRSFREPNGFRGLPVPIERRRKPSVARMAKRGSLRESEGQAGTDPPEADRQCSRQAPAAASPSRRIALIGPGSGRPSAAAPWPAPAENHTALALRGFVHGAGWPDRSSGRGVIGYPQSRSLGAEDRNPGGVSHAIPWCRRNGLVGDRGPLLPGPGRDRARRSRELCRPRGLEPRHAVHPRDGLAVPAGPWSGHTGGGCHHHRDDPRGRPPASRSRPRSAPRGPRGAGSPGAPSCCRPVRSRSPSTT
jgi:hypothetical protein